MRLRVFSGAGGAVVEAAAGAAAGAGVEGERAYEASGAARAVDDAGALVGADVVAGREGGALVDCRGILLGVVKGR